MSKGVSRPTLYDVQLPVMADRGVNSFTNNYIGLYCVAVDLPETRVNTITANGHEHIGIVRDQPTQMLYGKPLTLTIIADKDYNSYKAIRTWLDVTTPFGANQDALRTQRMSFHTDLVAPITLTKLELPANQKVTPDRDNFNYTNLYKRVLRFEFINAFPMSLGAVSLGSDRTDSYVTFDATFMFESYRLDTDLRNENGVG